MNNQGNNQYNRQPNNPYHGQGNNPNNAQPTNPNYGSGNPYYGQPYPEFPSTKSIGFIDAIVSGFKNAFNFTGKASVAEFWWWALLWGSIFFAIGTLIFLGFISYIIADDELYDCLASEYDMIQERVHGILSYLYTLIGILTCLYAVSIIPTISLTARRYHDLGMKGWPALLLPAIFIIMLVDFVLLISESYVNHSDIGFYLLFYTPILFFGIAIIQSIVLAKKSKPDMPLSYP